MKNKILITLLFILFAILIPVSTIYFLMAYVWFFGVFTGDLSFIETISALLRMIISASYLFVYVFAFKKTWKENLTLKLFLLLFLFLIF